MPAIRSGTRRSRIVEALEESVRLQSHYATLLNAYDGGHRMTFASAQDWIDRLQAVRIAAAMEKDRRANP